MPFQTTYNLLSSSGGIAISGWSPFTLTINPSGLLLPNKLIKLVYSWGDGITQTISLAPSLSADPYVPISAEPGDPRNTILSHDYTISSVSANFNLQVCAWTLNVSAPIVLNLSARVFLPSNLQNVIQSFRLVDARMFGQDDRIFYVLESNTPNYIIPILVNWNTINVKDNIVQQQPLILPLNI